MSRPTGYPDYNDRLDFWSLHSNYPQALKEQTALPRRPGLLTGKKILLTCRNRHLPRDLGAAPAVTEGVRNRVACQVRCDEGVGATQWRRFDRRHTIRR